MLLPLQGPRATLGVLSATVLGSITVGLGFLALLMLLRLCFRRRWIAGLVFAFLWTPVNYAALGEVPNAWPVHTLGMLVTVWMVMRFGLFAYVVLQCSALMLQLPIAVDKSMEFDWIRYLVLGTILGLASYGAWVSTRPKLVQKHAFARA